MTLMEKKEELQKMLDSNTFNLDQAELVADLLEALDKGEEILGKMKTELELRNRQINAILLVVGK